MASETLETETATEPSPRAPTGETRRARLRRELTAEIVRIAREQLTSTGPGSVTWRGIAREVGMNPASLYTYFDSLDDLYTQLIIESSTSLGAAVQAAFDAHAEEDPIGRAVACVEAYRTWAVERPAEFNLIFTDLLPGYEAPDDGRTYEAEMTIFEPLSRAVAAVSGAPTDPRSTGVASDADQLLGLFATMHGLVSLEINHHLPGDDHAGRFERVTRAELERLATS